MNDSVSMPRGGRGGFWSGISIYLSSFSDWYMDNPDHERNIFGFRVASLSSSANEVPEPGSVLV
ncbi:MAG: hypothetical protein P8N76_04800 [Pirellulaceae bacterium]|nr:hypothetical protein [Planctomycetaceae bacterium]MDG2380970.1 hypothetical protein [Pirellulaceae bacterium]